LSSNSIVQAKLGLHFVPRDTSSRVLEAFGGDCYVFQIFEIGHESLTDEVVVGLPVCWAKYSYWVSSSAGISMTGMANLAVSSIAGLAGK
jgi:hypothetical protein